MILEFSPIRVQVQFGFQSSDSQVFNQVFIYDNAGRLVLTSTKASSSVDVSFLASGAYSVVTDNNKIAPIKIIKQ